MDGEGEVSMPLDWPVSDSSELSSHAQPCMLKNRQKKDGPDSLPIPIIQRCGRIEEI